jgi:signal transduction histidine kinase
MFRLKAWSRNFHGVLEIALLLVTFAVIAFFSYLINTTTALICENDGARQFIERIRGVPLEPWKVTAYSCSLFAVLVLSSLLHSRLGERAAAQVVASLCDLVICCAIIAVLDFSYRGVLFVAIVNAMRFVPRARLRYGVIALCIAAFIFADYDIVALNFPVFSIDNYMDYYRDSTRVFFYGAKNLLVSINEILFIVFMIMEVNSWIAENSKIRDLNRRLVKMTVDLRLANVGLEEYSRRSEETARVKERNRLAREIHDILGHSLTGIEIGLKACLEILRRDPERVYGQLAKISELARSGLAEVRRSVQELKPDEGSGLVESLENLVGGIGGGTGRGIALEVAGERRVLPPLVEEALYRAVQEGLTNAIRHGEADCVEVELRYGTASVELAIRDDGKGCPEVREGFGLRSMRERAEALGGQALFANRERGFAVMVSIPSREGEGPA